MFICILFISDLLAWNLIPLWCLIIYIINFFGKVYLLCVFIICYKYVWVF